MSPSSSSSVTTEDDNKKTKDGSDVLTTQDDETSTTSSSPNNPNRSYTMDDLTELIRAIKFAYPDYGLRRVHREIVDVAAVTGNEPLLKEVKLNEVKKILKQLDAEQQQQQNDNPDNDNDETAAAAAAAAATTTGTVKMYTVGNGGVKSLVDEYGRKAADMASSAAAAAAAAATTDDNNTTTTSWVHYFLDVPADRSGQKPHQALINFSDNNKDGGGGGGGGKRKKQSKNKTKGDDIVKIQIAFVPPGAGGEGSDDVVVKHPMLLYNSDRSCRTFIHPEEKDDEEETTDDRRRTTTGESGEMIDGYDSIYQLISENGIGGALGSTGGKKGYFRCRIQKAKGVISVDVSGLAPEQAW